MQILPSSPAPAGPQTQIKVPGTTTARTLGERFGEVWNVLDWGADPTGVADSTANFVAAFQACSAAGGGVVFAPPAFTK